MPESAAMSKKNDDPDDKEAALWSAATRDVKPLSKQGGISPPEDKKPAPAKKPVRTVQAPLKSAAPVLTPKAPASAGLDRRTQEKLRKGQIPIEARLDLHGLSKARAHAALQDFIAQAAAQRKRCVLVITGKGGAGLRSPLDQGTGVLKRSVPVWLAEEPLKALVLKVQGAQPRHGGAGALYVYIRRQK